MCFALSLCVIENGALLTSYRPIVYFKKVEQNTLLHRAKLSSRSNEGNSEIT